MAFDWTEDKNPYSIIGEGLGTESSVADIKKVTQQRTCMWHGIRNFSIIMHMRRW